jgi:hypothetical protein
MDLQSSAGRVRLRDLLKHLYVLSEHFVNYFFNFIDAHLKPTTKWL